MPQAKLRAVGLRQRRGLGAEPPAVVPQSILLNVHHRLNFAVILWPITVTFDQVLKFSSIKLMFTSCMKLYIVSYLRFPCFPLHSFTSLDLLNCLKSTLYKHVFLHFHISFNNFFILQFFLKRNPATPTPPTSPETYRNAERERERDARILHSPENRRVPQHQFNIGDPNPIPQDHVPPQTQHVPLEVVQYGNNNLHLSQGIAAQLRNLPPFPVVSCYLIFTCNT